MNGDLARKDGIGQEAADAPLGSGERVAGREQLRSLRFIVDLISSRSRARNRESPLHKGLAWVATIFVGVLASVAILALIFESPQSWRQGVLAVLWLGSHALAAIMAWLALRANTSRDRFWFAAGVIFYALGQLLQMVRHYPEFWGTSSPTDLLAVMLGPMAVIGCLVAVVDRVPIGQRLPVHFDALAFGLAIAGAAMPSFFSIARDLSLAESIVAAALPVCLFSAFAGLSSLVLHSRTGNNGYPLVLMAGFAATSLAWAAWHRQSMSASAAPQDWLVLSKSICAVILGLGLVDWKFPHRRSKRNERIVGMAVDFFPIVALLLAIAMIIWVISDQTFLDETRHAVVYFACAIIVSCLLRQSHLLWRMRQSVRPAEEADIAAASANPFGSQLVHLGTWVYDVASGQETWSPEAREIYGIADSKLYTSEDYLPTIDPRDRARAKASFDAALTDRRTSYSAEFRIQHPTRGEKLVLDRGWIERDTAGRAIRVFGLVFDVTELRSVENDLARSKDRLDLVLAETGAGIWEWKASAGDAGRGGDADWTIAATGLELFDEEYQERIDPADRAAGVAWREQLMSGEVAACEVEFRLREADGQPRWIMCRGIVTERDPATGQPSRISGVKIDITAQKAAEEALVSSQAALDGMMRRYHQFFNNMRNIIICLGTKSAKQGSFDYDESGVLVLGQDAYDIAGAIVPGTSRGDLSKWYATIAPEDYPAYIEADRRRKMSGQTFEITFRVRNPETGQSKWLREIGWTTRDPVTGATHFDGYLIDVTREKGIEAALQESEARYRNAELVAKIFNWISTPDEVDGFGGRRVEFSPTAAALLGVPMEALKIRAVEFFDRFVHPDDRDRLKRRIDEAVNNHEPSMAIEYRVNCGDGRLAHFLANFRFEYDENNSPTLAYGTMQDVTEQRKTEQALRDSEELYRQAEMAAHLVHWSSGRTCPEGSRDERPLFSDTAEVLFGLPADAMPMSHSEFLEQMIHPADKDRVREQIERAEELRLTEYPLEYRIIRPDGRVREIYEVIKDIRDENGKWLSSFGTMLDVTQSRRMARELQESKSRYETAERIAGLCHWVCEYPVIAGGKPKIVFSRTASEILGVGESELSMTGNEFSERFVHPEDRQRVIDSDEAKIKAGETEGEAEYRIVRPDGGVLFVHENWRHEFDETGKPNKSYGVIQDITERKRVEQALRAARASAESANRAKTQFLANTSHELRTPLNAIIGFSEIMSNEIFGPIGMPAYKKYSSDIHASGLHLLGIINDLLDLSRIEAGETRLTENEVDIVSLVSSALNVIRGKASERGVSLQREFPVAPVHLYCDGRLLKQVLINLLSNAVKFTPSGGEIRIAMRESESGFDVAVSDTGIGMSEEEIASVGRPFVQVESWLVRTHDGVGLGLAISRSLMELHGGQLIIESEKGRGTVVTARLPLSRVIRRQKLA